MIEYTCKTCGVKFYKLEAFHYGHDIEGKIIEDD